MFLESVQAFGPGEEPSHDDIDALIANISSGPAIFDGP
jgi:hypothetical protein